MQDRMLDEGVYEVKGYGNTAYRIKREDLFYEIGFKVLQNQGGGSLLNCHRLKYNGDIKLVYFTDGLLSLEQLMEEADAESMGTAVSSFVSAVRAVEDNGFLNIVCMDNRPERIFFEPGTLTVKLIYLPLHIQADAREKASFEDDLRKLLAKAIRAERFAENRAMQEAAAVLTDTAIPFAEMAEKVQAVFYTGQQKKESVVYQEKKTEMYVLAEKNGGIDIPITKDEFLIGKNAEKVDGVITGNSAISRVHCRIMRRDGKLFVQDMGSVNGTYVNERRIMPEECAGMEEGSRIKLADMEFILRRS